MTQPTDHDPEMKRLFALSDKLTARVRGLLGKTAMTDKETETLHSANTDLAAVTNDLIKLVKKRTKAIVKGPTSKIRLF